MPQTGFSAVRHKHNEALKEEAKKYGESVSNLIPAMLDLWRSVPTEKHWQHIFNSKRREVEGDRPRRQRATS